MEQNGQKEANNKNNSEETTAIVADGEVLIIVSYDDACIYTSSHDSDWILDLGASYHATPSRESLIF